MAKPNLISFKPLPQPSPDALHEAIPGLEPPPPPLPPGRYSGRCPAAARELLADVDWALRRSDVFAAQPGSVDFGLVDGEGGLMVAACWGQLRGHACVHCPPHKTSCCPASSFWSIAAPPPRPARCRADDEAKACSGATCSFNNPQTPYGLTVLPLAPGEDLAAKLAANTTPPSVKENLDGLWRIKGGSPVYQLQQDEVIVVGASLCSAGGGHPALGRMQGRGCMQASRALGRPAVGGRRRCQR